MTENETNRASGEQCARCLEVGEDRRTLWMACFYAMNELGVPFNQVQVYGKATPKIGEKAERWGVVPVFADPTPDAEDDYHRLFTLRVCKDCRADWMAAIKVWFKTKPAVTESCGSGIFIRENGATKEITEEEWRRRNQNREPYRVTEVKPT